MKKYICMILAVVMIAATLAACGSNETKKVATDGSTSMEKMIGALGEAFMENTGATFTYNPTGSGTGIKAVKDTVKAISVNGVAPSEATIKDGSYPVQRPFVLVTKEGVALSKTAQEFFDFVTSDKANEIISAAGVVPAN